MQKSKKHFKGEPLSIEHKAYLEESPLKLDKLLAQVLVFFDLDPVPEAILNIIRQRTSLCKTIETIGGATYQGSVIGGIRVGSGYLTLETDDINERRSSYLGQFDWNTTHGIGKWREEWYDQRKVELSYTGDFVYGQPSGYGVFQVIVHGITLVKYMGQYKKGRRNGRGIQFMSN